MSVDVGEGYVQVTDGKIKDGDEFRHRDSGRWFCCESSIGSGVVAWCEGGTYIVRRKAPKAEPVQQIPGVPEGWRIVRFGLPKEGEYLLDEGGQPGAAHFDFIEQHCLIVERIEPEKPKTRKIVLHEYACLCNGDWCISWNSTHPSSWGGDFTECEVCVPTGNTREIEIPVQ